MLLTALTQQIETAPWQTVAGNAESGIGADDRAGTGGLILDDQGGQQINVRTDGKAPTLRAEMHGTLPCIIEQAAGFDGNMGAKAGNIGYKDETAPTLNAGKVMNVVFSFDSISSNSMKSKNPYSGYRQVKVCKTLDASGPDPSKNQGGIAVVQIKGQHLFENHSQDTRFKGPLKVCPMLPAQLGTGGNNTPFVVEGTPVYCLQGNGIDRALTAGCNGKGWKEGQSYTLNTIDRTLQAKPNGGYSLNFHGAVRVRYIVRRLTPTECARLQGFPDKWGHPDKKETLTDDEYRFWLEVRNTHAAINGKAVKEYTNAQMLTWYNKLHSDSAEYKMWGNGISLPIALYVLSGIAEHVQEDQEEENSNVR